MSTTIENKDKNAEEDLKDWGEDIEELKKGWNRGDHDKEIALNMVDFKKAEIEAIIIYVNDLG